MKVQKSSCLLCYIKELIHDKKEGEVKKKKKLKIKKFSMDKGLL